MSAARVPFTRLEEAAVDNGFDLVSERVAEWLPAGSSHAPLGVWLTVDGDHPNAALSRGDVAAALADVGATAMVALPARAAAARDVPDVGTLHLLVRRAYQLARTLPNELLRTFTEQTAALPRATVAERLVGRSAYFFGPESTRSILPSRLCSTTVPQSGHAP